MMDRDQNYASQDFDPVPSAHELKVFIIVPLLTDSKPYIFSLFTEYMLHSSTFRFSQNYQHFTRRCCLAAGHASEHAIFHHQRLCKLIKKRYTFVKFLIFPLHNLETPFHLKSCVWN
jgi:hypothetical protein